MTDHERGGWEPAVDLEKVPGVALQAEVQVVWLILKGAGKAFTSPFLLWGITPLEK